MRVAVYQCRALTGDIRANLNRLAATARGAAACGAEILVLPEMYLTGYALGARTAELAMRPGDAALAEVAALARGHRIALVLGYPGRDGDAVYNMATLWDAAGNPVADYAKIHLFGDEERRVFTPGEALRTAALGAVSAGLLICYDVEFPDPARRLAAAGCGLILAPTANMMPYTAAASVAVRARALENAVPVVYANYVGVEGALTYTGLSAIAGPDGNDIARAGSEAEVLLVAEVPVESAVPASSVPV